MSSVLMALRLLIRNDFFFEGGFSSVVDEFSLTNNWFFRLLFDAFELFLGEPVGLELDSSLSESCSTGFWIYVRFEILKVNLKMLTFLLWKKFFK
jgi:hypothetical protein